MPSSITIVSFGELLRFASQNGTGWNAAHNFLTNDEVGPTYDCNAPAYTRLEIQQNQYGWSAESVELLDEFCQYHDLDSFTLIHD